VTTKASGEMGHNASGAARRMGAIMAIESDNERDGEMNRV